MMIRDAKIFTGGQVVKEAISPTNLNSLFKESSGNTGSTFFEPENKEDNLDK